MADRTSSVGISQLNPRRVDSRRRARLSQKLVDLFAKGLICCPVEITAERVRPGGRRRDNGSLPGLERENVRHRYHRLTYRVITAFIFTHHRY